ncbi:Uncharacterised protein [uncultured archaeon]|nr:Uncharacterised protein [uncultured archaeon]
MKRGLPASAPSALACGLLEDGNRALFLCRKSLVGAETVELPCCLLQKGENPVAALATEFRRQTGIDGQVHDVLFEKRHNIGSKKRRLFVPALVFKVTAKNASVRAAPEFSGCRWISSEDLAKHRLARNCQWLLR